MSDPSGWAAMVARAYGLGAPLGPPVYATRGELGRIWRLDTEDGSWAVKELLVPVEERAARADTAFQLAAAGTGVRLPRPRLTVDGAVLHGGFRVYAWVDLAGEVTAAELGTATAALHRVAHPASGPVEPWFAEPLGRAAWTALAQAAGGGEGTAPGEDPADQGGGERAVPGEDQAALGGGGRAVPGGEPAAGGVAWGWALEQVLPELVALDALVVAPDARWLTTCHRDVNLENVLRARDDGGVVVLDWENCGPGRPSWELAAILADLADDKQAEAAYRAYLTAGGPAVVAEPADFSMAIAVQGHLLELYAGRALSEREQEENRLRARRRLGTMLARPLTRARVEALLTLCHATASP